MSYIDTNYLGKCETCRNFRNGKCNTYCDHGEEYSPNLSKIPTADVEEVRHGYWIADRSPIWVEYQCSECDYSYTEDDPQTECDYIYCPHCGAKMDGGRAG